MPADSELGVSKRSFATDCNVSLHAYSVGNILILVIRIQNTRTPRGRLIILTFGNFEYYQSRQCKYTFSNDHHHTLYCDIGMPSSSTTKPIVSKKQYKLLSNSSTSEAYKPTDWSDLMVSTTHSSSDRNFNLSTSTDLLLLTLKIPPSGNLRLVSIRWEGLRIVGSSS